VRTFVLRLWTGGLEELASDPASLRGVVEEVATGEATRFTRADELLDALMRAAQSHEGPPASEGGQR
jgi:hypothetical protein